MTVRRGVSILTLALGALLLAGVAQAQEGFLGKAEGGFLSKTDLSLVINGDITKSVSGIGESQGTIVKQSATDSGGVLFGLRYHMNPLLAIDVNYGYTRNFQDYVTATSTAQIQSGVHIFTGAAVLTAPQALMLKQSGLDYYNHNLDTSPEYYSEIITTRTYRDRLDTLAALEYHGDLLNIADVLERIGIQHH